MILRNPDCVCVHPSALLSFIHLCSTAPHPPLSINRPMVTPDYVRPTLRLFTGAGGSPILSKRTQKQTFLAEIPWGRWCYSIEGEKATIPVDFFLG